MRKFRFICLTLIASPIFASAAGLATNTSVRFSIAQEPDTASPTRQVYPAQGWKKVSSPAEEGWSPERLKVAREFSQKAGSTAVIIVMNGVVIDEWGDTAKPINIRSMRKSLLSALYGIATQEGKIRLDSTLDDLKIDDKEKLTVAEKRARVADLLKSQSGVYHPAAYETKSARESRPARGSHAPGSFFYYNNWDFNALGSIFEQQTKTKIFESFERSIARPLQMEDFSLRNTKYHFEDASVHSAYIFRMSARDLARFGLLYLRKGQWNSERLISEEWIEESTRSQVENVTRDANYGYLWWVYPPRNPYPGAYAAQGAGAQYLFIVPQMNVVIVHLSDPDNSPSTFNEGDGWQLLRLIFAASPRAPRD